MYAPIPKGGRIGIIAPAGTFDPALFKAGLKVITALGWEPVVAQTIWQKRGYLAGDDTSRVEQLHQMFADPSIDAVMCARGGYGAMRLLPKIKLELIAANPKPFVGFSDITVLLNLFCERCGMVTFHGPMVTALAAGDPQSTHSLHRVLSCPTDYRLSFTTRQVLSPGAVTAPIKGGNLTMLTHLAGTPYCPDFTDTLLLLEDCNEELYRIDRKLTHLSLSGGLDRIAGLLLGSFTGCGSLEAIHRRVVELFGRRLLPIVGGIDAGHGPVNRTIPLGLPVTLDTDAGCVVLEHVAA